ncbi:hypothetical protein [Hymenobacter crusticola]|uniref:Nucleotide-diphospho-sugar transferase domain-containing protein n=1 Tax=Hymenobacter crusticola TaxID=1770526 RepID=A0A243WJB2_9BACT|nr:hypothetical protein [Hymenobacter crusticola]OUJ75993.1 hypothetical protein BXP70_01545 [Hymenobacter crusticola]
MTRHIILSYGRSTEHQRAIFAILSFWSWYTGDRSTIKTVVYTDQPAAFAPYLEGLPIEYKLLTPASLEEMYGPQRYIHRAKAVIIDQLFRDYPTDRVLFCDSDTFFVASSDELLGLMQPGVSLMHMREARYVDSVTKGVSSEEVQGIQKAVDYIDSHPFQIGSRQHQFQKTQFMWNSGVLGLTEEVASLLPDVCATLDTLYRNGKWLVTEQVAFSLVLPTKTKLLASNHYVFHYWFKPLKVLMDGLLAALLTPQFTTLTVSERLTKVKHLTNKWPHLIVLSNAREEVIRGFSGGGVIHGLKSAKLAVDTLPSSPFNAKFAKSLFNVLTHKPLR